MKIMGFRLSGNRDLSSFPCSRRKHIYYVGISNFEEGRSEMKEVVIVKQSDSDGAGQGDSMN
jgi:hypothetical protein